jgi:hypothetical protein
MIGDPRTTRALLTEARSGRWSVFTDVDATKVDPVQRITTVRALADVCVTLQVDAPIVRWFDLESPVEAAYAARWGWRDWSWWPAAPDLQAFSIAELGEIWIRRGLQPVETVREVARCARLLVADGRSLELRAIEAEMFAARAVAGWAQ